MRCLRRRLALKPQTLERDLLGQTQPNTVILVSPANPLWREEPTTQSVMRNCQSWLFQATAFWGDWLVTHQKGTDVPIHLLYPPQENSTETRKH